MIKRCFKLVVVGICLLSSLSFSLTRSELSKVGEKIYLNETGGKRELLVHWNIGEEFPSLGIGHFIWYPSNYDGPYDESFPKLVKYYREKGIKLPPILDKNLDAPWRSLEEFKHSKGSQEVEELTKFLEDTKGIQIEFIYSRLETLVVTLEDSSSIKEQFYRVANTSIYPLIDYVNFKGEGSNSRERYNGYGWGLIQVLELMKGKNSGEEALLEFTNGAKYVLARRVGHSDFSRGEVRWIPGWYKRIDTYLKK